MTTEPGTDRPHLQPGLAATGALDLSATSVVSLEPLRGLIAFEMLNLSDL
jgi:hypothetical protein